MRVRRSVCRHQPGLFAEPVLAVGARVIAHYGREKFPGVIAKNFGGGPPNHLPVMVDGWEIPVWFSITSLELAPVVAPALENKPL